MVLTSMAFNVLMLFSCKAFYDTIAKLFLFYKRVDNVGMLFKMKSWSFYMMIRRFHEFFLDYSVEITEFHYHYFLTKISWNHFLADELISVHVKFSEKARNLFSPFLEKNSWNQRKHVLIPKLHCNLFSRNIS